MFDLENEEPLRWNWGLDGLNPLLEKRIGPLRPGQDRGEHAVLETIWNSPRKAVRNLETKNKTYTLIVDQWESITQIEVTFNNPRM